MSRASSWLTRLRPEFLPNPRPSPPLRRPWLPRWPADATSHLHPSDTSRRPRPHLSGGWSLFVCDALWSGRPCDVKFPRPSPQASGGWKRRPAALEAGGTGVREQLHQQNQCEHQRHTVGPGAALGAEGHRGEDVELGHPSVVDSGIVCLRLFSVAIALVKHLKDKKKQILFVAVSSFTFSAQEATGSRAHPTLSLRLKRC